MGYRLRLIYAIILFDVIAAAAIGPVMPGFVRGLPEPQVWLALGTGLFLGIQLVSAPLLGELADGVGRRPVFIASALGTVLATLLLLPGRRGLFFANRASDGLTNGMYSAVRAAITDLSPPEKVFRNLGIEGAIISLGFVIGPLISGLALTLFNVPPAHETTVIVRLVVAIAALNVGLTWLLRETLPNPPGVSGAALRAAVKRALNPLGLWARLGRLDDATGTIRRLILTQVALTLCTGCYFYFVPYLSAGALRMSPRDISYFFIFFGALSIAFNYWFYTWLADRLDPRRAVAWLAGLGVPVLLGYAVVGASRPALYGLVTLDCLTYSLIAGMLEGQLAQQTAEHNRGEIFGLSQAFQGLASFVSTFVFGALSLVDLRLPWVWFALCLVAVVGLSGSRRAARPAAVAPA